VVDGYVICVPFLLSLRLKLSRVSVVFDFSNSLNNLAPASPMPLSADVMRKETSEWFVDAFRCLLSLVITL
jgi:hypothetical protein